MLTVIQTAPGRVEAFQSRINKDGPIAPHMTTPCWIWTGTIIRRPKYGDRGQFWVNGKPQYAARVAWELVHGPIPEGLHVLHHCDVPLCVREDGHLFLGTHQDNMRDRDQKGRRAPPCGSQNGNAKLNEEYVRNIRRRLEAGEVQSVIAADYGVTHFTISLIHLGKTWTHVRASCA